RTMARTSARPGNSILASAHATGAARTTARMVAPTDTSRLTASAVLAPARDSSDPAWDQGARTASATSGTSAKASAGTASSAATRDRTIRHAGRKPAARRVSCPGPRTNRTNARASDAAGDPRTTALGYVAST